MIVLTMVLALGASAQGKFKTELNCKRELKISVTAGVKVAMNVPHFWGGKLPHGMRNGGQVGLWAEFRPKSEQLAKWSVLTEACFSSQGGKFTINQALAHFFSEKIQLKGMLANVNQDIIVTENYINVPVLLRYRFLPAFSVEAGPQIGFNVYSRARIDGIDNYNLNLSERTCLVDVSIGTGATYYLTDYLMFNARYNLGLTHTFKDIDDRNGNIQVGAAFRF